jgi:hypothetical protein
VNEFKCAAARKAVGFMQRKFHGFLSINIASP